MPRNVKLACAALVTAVAAVYARTGWLAFVGYDDPGYVTDNAAVRRGLSLDGVGWAFRSLEQSNWHPVTWLSHMLDATLFGLNPAGHHLTSVAIHAASAALLFLVLFRLTARPWRSLAVAALFALHPLHVESVAWVAERKDVLSGLLFHATLLLYVGYVRRPGAGRYLATIGCFAVGLMAKPMLVTAPAVLLVLDAWPLGRLRRGAADEARAKAPPAARVLAEKIPFLLLSLASAAVTLVAQHRGESLVDLEQAPAGFRIANAVVATGRYLGKALWPSDLAVLYPLSKALPAWEVLGCAAVLLAITAGAVALVRRAPYLLAGWVWFLAMLVPVIGLVQVGSQAMADRYTYLPLTGILVAVVWGAADALAGVRRGQEILGAAGAAAVAAAAAVTWNQLGFWRDSLALFEHTLAVTHDNYLMLTSYGLALQQAGRTDDAVRALAQAVAIKPRSPLVLNDYGAALQEVGRTEEAVRALEEAVAIDPAHAESYYNLGRIAHVTLGDLDKARGLYERAIALRPDYVDAEINLGGVLNRLGRPDRAIEVIERARPLAPDRPELRFNAGVAYAALGDPAAALREADALRRIEPALAARLADYVARMAPGAASALSPRP